MYTRLIDFINKNELLLQHQLGFQRRKSKEHAKLDLYSNVIKGIEKHKKNYVLFLNFGKAFGTVNHKILLKKLHHYGVRGIALKWLQSYVTNRIHAVKLEQHLSDRFVDILRKMRQFFQKSN